MLSAIVSRRTFVVSSGTAMVASMLHGCASMKGGQTMYGLIGKALAVPGQRDALIQVLLEGTLKMPGCLSYVVAKDTTDPNAIWITEVWDSEESHRASLSLPSVRAAIAKGRPMIAGFGERFVTEPVGGPGFA